MVGHTIPCPTILESAQPKVREGLKKRREMQNNIAMFMSPPYPISQPHKEMN